MSHMFLKMKLSLSNPASAAQTIMTKDMHTIAVVLAEMNPHKAAPILENIPENSQPQVVKSIPNVSLHDMLNCCEIDQVVHFLNIMDNLKAKWMLEKWDMKKRAVFFSLMQLPNVFKIMQCWHMNDILILVKTWPPRRLAELIHQYVEEPMVQSIIDKLDPAIPAAALDTLTDNDEVSFILSTVSFDKMMTIVNKMSIAKKTQLIAEMNKTQMILAFEKLPPGTVAEIIWDFSPEFKADILNALKGEYKKEVKEKLDTLKELKKAEAEDKKAKEKLEKEREQLEMAHEKDYEEEFEDRIEELEKEE